MKQVTNTCVKISKYFSYKICLQPNKPETMNYVDEEGVTCKGGEGGRACVT